MQEGNCGEQRKQKAKSVTLKSKKGSPAITNEKTWVCHFVYMTFEEGKGKGTGHCLE